jgi:hypothetical protein
VHILLLVFVIVQAAQTPAPPPSARGDRFQIMVPQGWKTLYDGGYVLLEHSSGASVMVERINRTTNLLDYAQRQAERIMSPLGFAKMAEPKHFKDTRDEWVQYEILGNRISDRHRILYRVLRRDSGFFELVYEAPEERFDSLITQATDIASSLQTIIEAPPARRARR